MICEDGVHFPEHMTVAVIGAGPAGLGVARVLRDLAIPDVWVLERDKIGQSFRDWPAETKLLTPSFPGNVFGITDLNAVSYDSSPGWSLRTEHPNGPAYARYLEQAAEIYDLNVQCGVDVQSITPEDKGFTLHTNHGSFTADFVIWACGQFGAPSGKGLKGAELGRHYGTVDTWTEIEGDTAFVIGGYESGMDAALGLGANGKKVYVLDRGAPWLDGNKDPSASLSPYTQQRLSTFHAHLDIELIPDVDIEALQETESGVEIIARDGRSWVSEQPPILATGFGTGTRPVSEHFDYTDAGLPLLTQDDESTSQPGLFLVGPEVSHNGHLFCFIYKFRQRFAVVAHAIAGRMGVDTAPLEAYYDNNMFLDDLSCCEADKCLC